MKDWKSFTLTENKHLRTIQVADQVVISDESTYRIEMEKESVDLKALETFVLKKVNGRWKITLLHFSGKALKPNAK